MFFYSNERQPWTGGTAKYEDLNAVKGYLGHYDNLMFLTFMANKGTFQEKAQARKELVICERKLKWWQNHPNYEQKAVLSGIDDLKRKWQLEPAN